MGTSLSLSCCGETQEEKRKRNSLIFFNFKNLQFYFKNEKFHPKKENAAALGRAFCRTGDHFATSLSSPRKHITWDGRSSEKSETWTLRHDPEERAHNCDRDPSLRFQRVHSSEQGLNTFATDTAHHVVARLLHRHPPPLRPARKRTQISRVELVLPEFRSQDARRGVSEEISDETHVSGSLSNASHVPVARFGGHRIHRNLRVRADAAPRDPRERGVFSASSRLFFTKHLGCFRSDSDDRSCFEIPRTVRIV